MIVAIHSYTVVTNPPLQKDTKDSSGQPQSLDHGSTSRERQRKLKLSYNDARDHIHMHVHTLVRMQTCAVYLAMEESVQQIPRTNKEQHYENKTSAYEDASNVALPT